MSPWLSNEPPVSTQNYEWNGLKDYHTAISKGLAGENSNSPSAGELDPENLLGTLGPEGLNAYHEAVSSALDSHGDLEKLVQHYQGLSSSSGLFSNISNSSPEDERNAADGMADPSDLWL